LLQMRPRRLHHPMLILYFFSVLCPLTLVCAEDEDTPKGRDLFAMSPSPTNDTACLNLLHRAGHWRRCVNKYKIGPSDTGSKRSKVSFVYSDENLAGKKLIFCKLSPLGTVSQM